MNVEREIAAHLAEIQAEQDEFELTARYRRAMEIMRTIPSGTRDADLTAEQATAIDEYEAVFAARAALREDA